MNIERVAVQFEKKNIEMNSLKGSREEAQDKERTTLRLKCFDLIKNLNQFI